MLDVVGDLLVQTLNRQYLRGYLTDPACHHDHGRQLVHTGLTACSDVTLLLFVVQLNSVVTVASFMPSFCVLVCKHVM